MAFACLLSAHALYCFEWQVLHLLAPRYSFAVPPAGTFALSACHALPASVNAPPPATPL